MPTQNNNDKGKQTGQKKGGNGKTTQETFLEKPLQTNWKEIIKWAIWFIGVVGPSAFAYFTFQKYRSDLDDVKTNDKEQIGKIEQVRIDMAEVKGRVTTIEHFLPTLGSIKSDTTGHH